MYSRAIWIARSFASLPLFVKYVTSRPCGIFDASFFASIAKFGMQVDRRRVLQRIDLLRGSPS